MIKFAGLWELGWQTPLKEIDLWEYPLRDFGVDELIMSPISGIRNSFVKEVHDLGEELINLRNNNYTIVFVDEFGKEDLKSFNHPKDNVVYVFGKATLSPMIGYGIEGDQSLKITTIKNEGLLWPHQAACLILYDRMMKSF